MFAEQFIVEPVFPSITALIAKLKQKLTPEQVAEQRFLTSGAVFFSGGAEGEPVRVEPIAIAEGKRHGGTYRVGDEEVYIERILDTTSYDGAAYIINGAKVYVASDFIPNDKARGGGVFEVDLTSRATGYIQSSQGQFVRFLFTLIPDQNTGDRQLLSPRDAAVVYCFMKAGSSKSELKRGGTVIKPLYPVVDLDTPDAPSPRGEAKKPHPV